jgi:alpha-beta hydrolase superfamily lysophospholipase
MNHSRKRRFCVFLVAALAVSGQVGCSSQPLEPWHTARLSAEFEADMLGDEVQTLQDYLALEERLFNELREDVYEQVDTGPEFALVRYSSGSAADPAGFDRDYNRTFELPVDDPRGGVLLLHGMSDSPYSLHRIGQTLNEAGFHVLGLRLPGHGAAPSGLKHVRWQDMAAVTRLGMEHLVRQLGSRPIHVVGYSTGAALALDLSLVSLEDPALRTPTSLVFISPAIGIAPAAALAGAAAALGRLPGMGRLAWSGITPEFDPFKFNSFTFNAGQQVHRLTRSVGNRIAALSRKDEAGALPPILVFKSAVDATVSIQAVVDRLLLQLAEGRSELVLFDINRDAVKSILLVADPGPVTRQLMSRSDLPFSVRLITNESPGEAPVEERFKAPRSAGVTTTKQLGSDWPPGVISLSHVALPFSPDDPLYGRYPPESNDRIFLGQAEIRGERGLLAVSSDWLLRLRYNPFFEVMESRLIGWVGEFDRLQHDVHAPGSGLHR